MDTVQACNEGLNICLTDFRKLFVYSRTIHNTIRIHIQSFKQATMPLLTYSIEFIYKFISVGVNRSLRQNDSVYCKNHKLMPA